MIKKEIYFIEAIPFRILTKKHYKTLILSNKGDYRSVDSSLLVDFKEGDYLIRKRMIGNGIVEINYAKMDDEKMWNYLQRRGLERVTNSLSLS